MARLHCAATICQACNEFNSKLGGSTGAIWNEIPFETPVIPAQAGIQSVGGAFPMACGVDSRFRGNDCTWEHLCLVNDTTTLGHSRRQAPYV
jgi:hypothetical protein